MKTPHPILVAEENPDDVFLLTRRIKAAGLENPLVTFGTPADTIAWLERTLSAGEGEALPCALLTDLHLLGGDGWEIIKWVRNQPALEGLKVFVLSGSDNPTDRRQAEELKVDGFFEKFPAVDAFAQMLRSTCGERVGVG